MTKRSSKKSCLEKNLFKPQESRCFKKFVLENFVQLITFYYFVINPFWLTNLHSLNSANKYR